jgi:hypothetical protein
MDSDSSAGNSADSDPPPPRRKKPEPKPRREPEVVKPPEPTPPKPTAQRLSKTRRDQIIADYQRGVFDKEYAVTENRETHTYRVTKRKGLYSPSASVESVAKSKPNPPAPDVTWVTMQKTVNDSLTAEMKALRESYEKLSEKYQKKKIKKRAKKVVTGGPISLPLPNDPPRLSDEEVRAAVLHPLRPEKKVNKTAYTRNGPIDIRNF